MNVKLVRNKKRGFKPFFKKKTHLMILIPNSKEEVDHLNSKLEGITKFIHMVNFGTVTLEKILGVGNTTKYMKVNGYTMSHPTKYV